jgi:hypothetical protein
VLTVHLGPHGSGVPLAKAGVPRRGTSGTRWRAANRFPADAAGQRLLAKPVGLGESGAVVARVVDGRLPERAGALAAAAFARAA